MAKPYGFLDGVRAECATVELLWDIVYRITLLLRPTILFGLIFGVGLAFICQKQIVYSGVQPVPIQESSQTTVVSPAEVVGEMLGQVNRSRVLNDLRQLTGEVPICTNSGCYTITNRLTGGEGVHWAMDYIYEDLTSRSYSAEFQDWSRSGWTDRNLVARKPGVVSPTEEVYLVAHVDGVATGGEECFPAADDDASGVVDNLEVARILSPRLFSRTLVILFSTGEEQGTLGVQSYIDQLSPNELSFIKYVVDVDMVGYDANHDGVMELWHGGHLPSLALAQMMSETIKTYQLDLAPRFIVGCG